MHEHILCDLRSPAVRSENADDSAITMENRFQTDYYQNRNPANMHLNETGVASTELTRFRGAGGCTIVDVTVGGMDPQPDCLAELAAHTGTSIVIGAGYYTDTYLAADVLGLPIDELAERVLEQLKAKAWGSGVRAGIIGEMGCSWPLTGCEEDRLNAAARAQRETGAAITVHPGRHPDAPGQIADILVEAGADPERTIIGHMDRTIFDRDRLRSLLSRGFVLEWDFFGIETSQYWMANEDLDLPTDYMRLDLIAELIQAGFEQQITISHDICTKTRLATYGGHGYSHLLVNIIPMMQRRGWKDAHIDQVFCRTPERLLGYLSEPDSISSFASK